MNEADNPKLYRIRHSLGHVLAQAVLQRFPKAKLGFGPPTDTGFYYDFDFGPEPLTESDLKDLEKRMKKILAGRQKFERQDGDHAQALEVLAKHRDEPYKIENLNNLRDRGVTNFSFYRNGPFLDLCEGPHVNDTGELPFDAFTLDRIAGAYWLGDEKRPMLTRIYALAYETRDQLDDFLKRRKIAEDYDHKKLGKELDIYHIDERIGKGLILWLPNGAVIRNEIQRFAEEVEFQNDYKRVSTPHITKGGLYETTGHLISYKDSMFPPMLLEDDGGETKFYLKPMNCPHHHLIFQSRMRSYRELPLRLAEYGTCYRYEQSGELSGLLRVRCMTMNDAHIYCTMDQLQAEVLNTLNMYKVFFNTFRLKEFRMRLSVRGEANAEKFQGDDAMWTKGETCLKNVLDESGFEYFVGEGEAAFYGPKIDIQFRNLMGREETVSTIQVDMIMAERLGLRYIDATGAEAMPVIIHRAPLSTHERFVSYLIEYYGGAFPTWCAPLQVQMIPVNDDCVAYCKELAAELKSHYVRCEIDTSDNSFNKKIRTNTMRKIPIMLVIGMKEVEERRVTVRRYGIPEQQLMLRDEFITHVTKEIKDRVMLREPLSAMI